MIVLYIVKELTMMYMLRFHYSTMMDIQRMYIVLLIILLLQKVVHILKDLEELLQRHLMIMQEVRSFLKIQSKIFQVKI